MLNMTRAQAQALLSAIPAMRPDEISIELLEAIVQLKKIKQNYTYEIVGGIISVIKQIRAMTGWSLKEAKNYYDAHKTVRQIGSEQYSVMLTLEHEFAQCVDNYASVTLVY